MNISFGNHGQKIMFLAVVTGIVFLSIPL